MKNQKEREERKATEAIEKRQEKTVPETAFKHGARTRTGNFVSTPITSVLSKWCFVAALALLVGACAGGKLKPVKDLAYAPYEKGFGYKSTAVPSSDFKKWAGANKKKLDENISGLDDGFQFVVIGHTDKCGPEAATGKKKGNDWYAKRRAENVRKALRALGYSGKKMQAISMASKSSKRASKCGPYNLDRRITFGVAKKSDDSN